MRCRRGQGRTATGVSPSGSAVTASALTWRPRAPNCCSACLSSWAIAGRRHFLNSLGDRAHELLDRLQAHPSPRQTRRRPQRPQDQPHSLRHSFASKLLATAVALQDVQDAMGHADPRTTRAYNRSRHNLDRHPTYTMAAQLHRTTPPGCDGLGDRAAPGELSIPPARPSGQAIRPISRTAAS